MDDAELTLIRTPATTALAIKHILAADSPERATAATKPVIETLVVFGTGPQACIVVESRQGAMREAGDLIPARSVEEWQQVVSH